MNKVIIEIDLPLSNDAEFCTDFLTKQTEFLVEMWRDTLARYKSKGIDVPTLAIKRPRGSAPVDITNEYKKQFFKVLIDHHLKYMPKAEVGPQMKVIKDLYATGKSTEELIALYEQSRESYKLTSWFTVKYNLSKPKDEEKPVFERKQLDKEEQNSIIKRLQGEE